MHQLKKWVITSSNKSFKREGPTRQERSIHHKRKGFQQYFTSQFRRMWATKKLQRDDWVSMWTHRRVTTNKQQPWTPRLSWTPSTPASPEGRLLCGTKNANPGSIDRSIQTEVKVLTIQLSGQGFDQIRFELICATVFFLLLRLVFVQIMVEVDERGIRRRFVWFASLMGVFRWL